LFPNNTLNSISPDGYMTQAFPNIFFLKEMAATSSIAAKIAQQGSGWGRATRRGC